MFVRLIAPHALVFHLCLPLFLIPLSCADSCSDSIPRANKTRTGTFAIWKGAIFRCLSRGRYAAVGEQSQIMYNFYRMGKRLGGSWDQTPTLREDASATESKTRKVTWATETKGSRTTNLTKRKNKETQPRFKNCQGKDRIKTLKISLTNQGVIESDNINICVEDSIGLFWSSISNSIFEELGFGYGRSNTVFKEHVKFERN